jgi:hypothetical protein
VQVQSTWKDRNYSTFTIKSWLPINAKVLVYIVHFVCRRSRRRPDRNCYRLLHTIILGRQGYGNNNSSAVEEWSQQSCPLHMQKYVPIEVYLCEIRLYFEEIARTGGGVSVLIYTEGGRPSFSWLSTLGQSGVPPSRRVFSTILGPVLGGQPPWRIFQTWDYVL